MVNFKFIGLPLLVGLMLGKIVYAESECSISTVDGVTVTASGCNSGYYYLTYTPTGGQQTTKMFQYTKGDSSEYDIITEISSAGYYQNEKDRKKHYLCENASNCEEFTDFSLDFVGYYKLNNYYVMCKSEDNSGKAKKCTQISLPTETCDENNVGKFVQLSGSNYGLCLAEYEDGETKKYPTLGFLTSGTTDDSTYLVKHVKDTEDDSTRVFNFDVTMNYYLVAHSENAIKLVTDSFEYECALADSSKHVSRKEDFCSIGSGRYFTCIEGKCKSFLQSAWNDQESNGEFCQSITVESSSSTYKFIGNCVVPNVSDLSYYVVSNGEIITNDESGNIVKLNDEYEYSSSDVKKDKGYYLNADVATQLKYPLIYCDGTDNGCKLFSEIQTGYYITNSKDFANVIACYTSTNCKQVESGSKEGNIKIDKSNKKIILIGESEYEFKYKEGVDKEYLLLNVDVTDGLGNFPGVTVKGNYAVHMKVEKVNDSDIAVGTISLLTKETSCAEVDDNNIIKKIDGQFYYCAGGVEVLMSSRAKFAISVDGTYQVLKLTPTEAVPQITTTDNIGYYVDRSKDQNGLVHCKSTIVDPEGGEKPVDPYLICESIASTIKDEYEVFINAETGFPGSTGTTLDAKIIVCSSEKCIVPEKSGSSYKHNNKVLSEKEYFINHQDSEVESLIKCSSINSGCLEENGKKGIYVNGIKDLSLIKCSDKTKSDEAGNDVSYVACDTMTTVVKYGHYASYDNSKYIECNNDKCYDVSDDIDGKTFINSDADSDKYIITCSNEKGCLEVEAGDYYIDSSLGGLNLLKCGESGCTKVEGKNRDVYISNNGKSIITCNTSECYIKEDEPEKENQAYFLNADVSSDSHYIITSVKVEDNSARKKRTDSFVWAPMEDKINAYDVFINGNNNGDGSYGIIYCSSETSCTEIQNTSNGKYYIDIMEGKSIKCGGSGCEEESEEKLPTGKSEGESYNFLIDISTSQILENGSGYLVTCIMNDQKWICEQPKSTGNDFYLDNFSSKNLIVRSSNGFTIMSAEEMINGYYVNSETDMYKCDKSECSKEVSNIDDCTNNIGAMTKSGEVCIFKSSDNEVKASVDSNKIYILSQVNSFPGTTEKVIMINASGNSIVQVKPTSVQYYLVGDDQSPVTSDSEEGTLYKCFEEKCEKLTPKETTYYPNSDESTFNRYSNIKCEKVIDEEKTSDPSKPVYKSVAECKLSAKSGDEVYCIKSTNNSKLYSCITNCEGSCYDITPKAGYYLPYEKSYLINCSSTSCSKYDKLSEGYYKSEDTQNSLILCSKSADGFRCQYEAIISNGYYIGASKNLIRCNNGECKAITNPNGWFVSAESGKALTYCTGSGNDLNCTAYTKPSVGYYKNGGNERNDTPLITCISDSSNTITCSEIPVPNKGYFLNASDFADNNILINCTNGSCIESVATSGYYYLNGVNKKLIYCITNKKCYETDGNGWFKVDSLQIINCNNYVCEYKSESEIKKGYYLNADKYTSNSNPLLINDEIGISLKEISNNGWYINAGSTSNEDKILRCQKGVISSCVTESVATDCTNGKFFEEAGVIKWCINNNEENLLISDTEDPRYIYANIVSKSFIPWISEGEGYIKFKIGVSSVEQEKIDGYSYDEINSKLYLCNPYGFGICNLLKTEEITPGYYINYSDNSVIRCGKYEGIVCENIENKKLKNENANNYYDVVIGNDEEKEKTYNKLYFYPVSTDTDPLIMKSVSSELLYAISNVKEKSFPKPKELSYSRYILVDVNKYYVKFRENIPEVSECDETVPNSEETEENKVCISNNKLLYVKTGKELGQSESTTIQVNKNDVKADIECKADTNDGYYEYKGDGNNNILKKVYIKKYDNNKRVDFKYRCPINGECDYQNMDKECTLGFSLNNGVLTEQKRNENSSNEVTEKISPGIRVIYDPSSKTKTNVKEVINCYLDTNNLILCALISRSSSGINYDGKDITADGVKSDKLHTKIVKKKVTRSRFGKRSSLDKRDSDEVLILKELSSTSYVESSFDQLTNVFLDNELKKITNEVLTVSDETKVTGYTCNSEGECIVIDKTGNAKYFLNSAQAGNTKNAIVVCGNIDEGDTTGRCRFIDAVNGSVYENYAATSSADALITCTTEGCATSAVTSTNGLPECKLNIINGIDIDESTKACIRSDNNQPLLDGQHCISNGIIYKTNIGTKCNTIDGYKNKSGIKLFDATFRELTIAKVAENHYGAMLYNCPTSDGKCYRTYGYIAGTTNTVTNYSVCNNEGCIYHNIGNLKNSCAEIGEGGLIYTNKNIKLCNTKGNVNSIGYYPVSISTNNNFPNTSFGDKILVSVEIPENTSVAIYTLVYNDGYILLNNKNEIVNENNKVQTKFEMTNASIYYCSSVSASCVIVDEPAYGYYRSSSYPDDLITIGLNAKNAKEVNIGSIDDLVNLKFTKGNTNYYPVASNFPGYSYSVVAESTEYSIVPFKTDNYILVNTYENRLATKSETRDMDKLFICNSSVGKCVQSNVEDGWYVSGQSGYEAIVCEKNSCIMKETINRSCSGEGDFIISDNEYNICILKDRSLTKYKLSENIGKVSELISTNIVFPNNKSYIVVNSNSVKGIGYRDVESGTTASGITVCKQLNSSSGIVTCLTNDGKNLQNNEYCLYNNKIYSNSTEAGVSSCTQKFTSGINVELFLGSQLLQTSTKDTIYGAQLFYCKDGVCRITSGYKKLGNTWYRCNYGSCEKKKTGTENGDLDGSNRLKTPDGLQSIAKDKYYYISGSNNFPGTENYKSFILEMSDKYIVPFIGNGYYLIGDNTLLSKDPSEGKYTSKTNRLYLCSSSDNNCVMVSKEQGNMIENAFYKNAASSEPSQKAIIGCYNNGNYSTACKIAEEAVIFDESIDKCEVSGKLVRTTSKPDDKGVITYGEYKLCIERGKEPVSINTTETKYYMISIAKNDTFAAIDLKNESDKVRNVIVEVSNGSISQYEKEGYILFNEDRNEIVETIGSNRGNLYYCERSENYKDAKKYSYSCDPVSNINNGWYFNKIYGDRRVIRCIENSCTIIEATEDTICRNSGSIIYNNGFKVCQTLEKQIDISSISENYDIIMNVSLLTDFPGLKTNNTNILISVKSNSVYQMKMKTNIVVTGDNKVVTSEGVKGNLYQCYDDGHCDLNIVPRDNYYVKSNSEKKDVALIKCEERQCQVILNETDNKGKGTGMKEGFRVSANKSSPLIQCVKPGEMKENTFVESGIAVCSEKDYKEGWFINSGSDSSIKPLIECTKESGCIAKAGITDGWYQNAGTNSIYSKIAGVSYPIIKCTNGSCNYVTSEIGSECKKEGEIIVVGGKYKICIGEGNSIEFSSSPTTEIITDEGSKIAVVSSSNKIVHAGDGMYLMNNVMYECVGTCKEVNGKDKNGIYVYDKVKSILNISDCTGDTCSWTAIKNEGNYFIDSSKFLVTNKATSVDKVYECLKDNTNKSFLCKDILESNIRGYFFNSEIKDINGNSETVLYLCDGKNCDVQEKEDIPKCSELSYRTNYCLISYEDEKDTEEYKGEEPSIDGGSICISGNKYYFSINEINTGKDQANCVAMPVDTNNYYYEVKNKSGISMVYTQNKFGVKRIMTSSSVINGMDTTKIISSKSSNNSIILEDNGNYVICIGGSCTANKLVSCKYSLQEEKCTISSGNVNAGELCLSEEGNIYIAMDRLSSSGGRCVNHKTSWSYSLGSDTVTPNYNNIEFASSEKYEPTYYAIGGKMYKIEYDNDIYIQEEGVYLIDSSNKKVTISGNVDISKGSQFTFYLCNSEGCRVKNTCNNGNMYEYIFDRESNKLIQCNPSSNKISYVKSNGYYLNSPWEDIVKCVNDICTELNSDIGMEGYYYDSGNSQQIIKCNREEGRNFKCVNENIVKCDYVAKTSTCTSTVDLKRNSYCVYINTVKGKIIGNPMMLYIENFIKAGDSGECIANEGNDEIYYHYRKSKFLGNEERNEIIRYTKGAIVSVYEKDIGYYIITTDTRKGVTEDTKLNKSRMYECTASGCVEQRQPENGRVYINKASTEKMIRFHSSGSYWEVMKRHCVKSTVNPRQCELASSNIKNGDIIYLFEEGYLNPEFLASKVNLSTKNTIIEDNNDKVDARKYQYFNTDGEMYTLNSNGQSFDLVNDNGYYLFKKSSNYHNLEPYRSTVNTTDISKIQVYSRSGSWSVAREFSFNNFKEGYYWNKADINGEGIILQVMNVPYKKAITSDDSLRKREEEKTVQKYKSVINKCSSVKKGICTSDETGKILSKGDACIVMQGDYQGLYLITENSSKNSSSNSCARYDGGNTYMYVDSVIEFAGQPLKKTLVEIGDKSISYFTEKTPFGYYVFDKNERKKLVSTSQVDATGYYCGWEYDPFTDGDNAGMDDPDTKRFECNVVKGSNTYYYTKHNDIALQKSDTKWNVENSKKYFFFNGDYKAASTKVENEKPVIDDVSYKSSNVNYPGTYINSASLNTVVVVERDGNGRNTIKADYKTCQVSGEICTSNANPTVEFVSGEVCVGTNKSNSLYLIIVNEQANGTKKNNCYGGTDKLRYRLANNKLYKIDGYSVQEAPKGYYIFNDNWDEYSATYPEVPKHVIYCDGNKCEEITDTINLGADVIINAAGTGNNRLLKYYPSSKKFVNVSKPGYYLLRNDNDVKKKNGNGDYSVRYYLDDSGNLSELPSSFSSRNIYINNAKEGYLTRDYTEFTNTNIQLNRKTGFLEYKGEANTENELKYLFIDNILYVQKPYHFEEVKNGLYAIKDNAAFEETEWTSLSTGTGICYYVNGSCDIKKLELIKKQQYTINMATKKPSVIEYSKEGWRMESEDGVYMFFEDGYSITSTDRRISRVFEVIEGESVEITNDENNYGFYLFNNMMVERNTIDGWEDGVKSVDNVEVESKRICKSYETNEVITTEKVCNDEVLGLCIPKSDILNESDTNNCIFSDGRSKYYFIIQDKLYSISNQSVRLIKKPGLYVVDGNKKIFEDKIESRAIAYACDEEGCKEENSLSAGYYLNMASGGIDDPAILYYNSLKKTWRKTSTNGYYLFNSKGYAVGNEEEVAFAYKIDEHGRNVISVINENIKGTFINQSSSDENVIVEYTTKWEKGKKVPECKISNGKVTSSEAMKVGDICLASKKMVIITRGSANNKRADEYSYDGITSEGKEKKYSYSSEEKKILKLEEGQMVKLDITGYVIIDKSTNRDLKSTEAVEVFVYKCLSGSTCEEADLSKLSEGSHVINAISEESPLVKLEAEGKWKVENENGYYFLNSDWNAVVARSVVASAIEVENDGDKTVQRDITSSKELGIYFNKAASSEILVSNEVEFWSKGLTVHKCNVTEVTEKGNKCRTFKGTMDMGDYCYTDDGLLNILTENISEESNEITCLSGTNENPLYVTSSTVGVINGINTGTKLVRLTDDSVKVVSPGIYILNENGTLIETNENPEIVLDMYICDEDGCSKESDVESNVKILTESGDIVEFSNERTLVKVEEEGKFFFKENGIACSEQGDEVSTVIEQFADGSRKTLELDELNVGAYINHANNKTVGIYDGEKWSIEESSCTYNEGECSGEGSMEVGNFCVVDGSIYIITEIDEENQKTKCMPGDDSLPIYFMNEDSVLMMVKEKSVSVVDNEGFYAINDSTRKALKSESPVPIKFFRCEVGMECNEVEPEGRSSYLNKAMVDGNIVVFNDKGSLKEATTIENHCTVTGSTCSGTGTELEAGDICVAENSLYLIKEDKQCVMAEKFVETYQFVNNKLYKLMEDTVIRKVDGYYFVDGENHAIKNNADYSKPDTVGYMCSVSGDCYLIVPSGVRYYKDYTTIVDGTFKVVKYDPEKKTKRDGNSSGYEGITESGIYRIDDGSYVECEIGSMDEISCKDISEEGAMMTIDDEVILCRRENKSIECVQATDGGYYNVGESLLECTANEVGDKLECTDIKKEGYFLADGKNVLYECVEEKPVISSVMNDMNGSEDLETEMVDEEDINAEMVIEISKRQVENENQSPEGVEGDETQKENQGDDEFNNSKEPVDVECKPIECVEATVIYSNGENSDALYVCKKIEKQVDETNNDDNDETEETDEEKEKYELKWVTSCESGNHLKLNDNYYQCEDKKDNINEEFIEKPNTDKTSTEPSAPITTTTKKPEDTTSSAPITTSSSSTSKSTAMTTSKSTSEPPAITTTTTTTMSATSTTTKASSTTTTATTTQPSGVSMRSIPSLGLMTLLFAMAMLLQYHNIIF